MKKVVKKGYRKGSSRDRSKHPHTDTETATADSQVPTAGPSEEVRPQDEDDMKGHLGTKGSWLAYAFVVFRDEAEAEEAKAAFDGVQLAPGWIARVLPAAEPRTSSVCGEQAGAGAGEDPPLGLQLFPPCLRPLERAAAIARHQAAAGYLCASLPRCASVLLALLALLAHPRPRARLIVRKARAQ